MTSQKPRNCGKRSRMKDPALMTHAERMSALTRELNSSSCVAKADKMLELIKHEWLDIRGVRDMAARRHGDTTPAPTMSFASTQPPVEASLERQVQRSEELQGADKESVASLVHRYRTDENSSYQKLRYGTRQSYDSRLRIIEADLGSKVLSEVKAPDLLLAYQEWTKRGITMAHGLVGMLRMLVNYGTTVLDNDACQRLSGILHNMRFKMGQPRTTRITAAQVIAIRKEAHRLGFRSLALAQALQFGLMLHQRDVIGEWIPETEPGDSDLRFDGLKWLRGLRWEEIDSNLILRHTTSKRKKKIESDLRKAPMVMEELRQQYGDTPPQNGPVIVSELTGYPYKAHDFRAIWRRVARAAGVPDDVRNMDSQASATNKATASNGFDSDAQANSPPHATETAPRRKSGPRRSELTERVIQMTREYLTGKKGPVATAQIFQFLIENGDLKFPEHWKTPQYKVHGMLSHSHQFRSHGRAGWTLEHRQ